MSQILFDSVCTVIALFIFAGITGGFVYMMYKLCKLLGKDSKNE